MDGWMDIGILRWEWGFSTHLGFIGCVGDGLGSQDINNASRKPCKHSTTKQPPQFFCCNKQNTTHGKLQEKKGPKRSPPLFPPSSPTTFLPAPPKIVVISKLTMQQTLGTSLHAMFILNTTFSAQKIPQLDQSSATRHLESLSLTLSLSLSLSLLFLFTLLCLRFTALSLLVVDPHFTKRDPPHPQIKST
jgi:hypothetical protein